MAMGPTRRIVAAAMAASLALLVAAGCTSDVDSSGAGAAGAGSSGDATSDGPNAENPTSDSDVEVQVLYSLDAASAQVSPEGSSFDVAMDVTGDVLAFTDRPVRAARRMTPRRFVERWDELFGDDPPNGALSGTAADGRTVDVAVEIHSATTAGATTVFTMEEIGVSRGDEIPTDLQHVSLFVDPHYTTFDGRG